MENTMLKERLAAKNEVVLNEKNFVALESNALDIIRENLKNQPLSMSLFDIVKSPSGGSTVFSVPGISGEEAEKSLTGIILDYSTPVVNPRKREICGVLSSAGARFVVIISGFPERALASIVINILKEHTEEK